MWRRGVAVWSMCATVLLAGGPAQACAISVGWEPYGYYSFRDTAGIVRGFDIDVFTALGQETGCAVSFRETPFARLMVELEQGVIHATSSLKKTPEREAFGWYTQPYRQSRIAMYVRRGEVGTYPFTDLGQFMGTKYRLGGVAGYYLGKRFGELMLQPAFAERVEMAVDQALNVQKLVNRRIDGLITDDDAVIDHITGEAGLTDKVERHPLVLEDTDLHLVFSRKSVDEATFHSFERALQAITADGRLAAIAAHYAAKP